jgi:hypothetical protein
MGRKTSTAALPDSLAARIQTFAQTYFIAADGTAGSRVEDEAILNITTTIESIGTRHQRFLGRPLEMDLICARSFASKCPTPKADKPVLLPWSSERTGAHLWSICQAMPSGACPG